MKLWTYKRPFVVDGVRGEMRTVVTATQMNSTLLIDDKPVGEDSFAFVGAPALRNNRVETVLPDGRRIEVESGYVGWWVTQIAVRLDGRLCYESKPGAKIEWPEYLVKKYRDRNNLPPEEKEKMQREEAQMRAQFQRNKPSLLFDIAVGLAFFVVAKYSNLTTAALVSAALGIAGWIVQRITKIDLLGGLATFGIIMSLITAGFALAFQDDDMVKMRSTILGIFTAVLFLGDGLLGGRFLGKRMVRYMPHPNTDPGRLTVGIGVVGLVMAVLNLGVAKAFSTDAWLFYTTFLDTILALALTFAVIKWAAPKT